MEDTTVDTVACTPSTEDKRCWFYFRKGCHNGDQCKFSHDDERTPERRWTKRQQRQREPLLLLPPAPETSTVDQPTEATTTTKKAKKTRKAWRYNRRPYTQRQQQQQDQASEEQPPRAYYAPPPWFSPSMVPPEMFARVPSVHCPYCWFFMTHVCAGDLLLMQCAPSPHHHVQYYK